MAVKFHINPDTGRVGQCSAKNAESCKFSVASGEVVAHYETREEAEMKVQKDLSEQYGTLTSQRTSVAKNKASQRSAFLKDFEKKTVEELIDFSNQSIANYRQLDKTIERRVEKTKQRSEALSRAEERKLMDKKTLQSHKRDFEEYRNRTAELVEAYTQSRHFKKLQNKYDAEKVGHAVKVENYPTHSREWYEARYNSVGGSDVSALVEVELDDAPEWYSKKNYERVVESKTTPVSDERLKNSYSSGALYRGTVWESKIREQYSMDHPERKVYEVDGQFAHPEREWQQVNLDGLVSDREDGVPNGILEIKTGSKASLWADGVPTGYRAQTLYYLNTTGLDYADVRALVNDNEVFEYRLHKDDEVVEGSGISMEEYIRNNVAPWFEELKKQR